MRLYKNDIGIIRGYVEGTMDGDLFYELENEPSFVMDVIAYTIYNYNHIEAKKTYDSLVNENMKLNYEFVKFIVSEFGIGLDWVRELLIGYLSNEVDENKLFKILKFLIENFKSDLELVCHIVDDNVDKFLNEEYMLELLILMSKVTKGNRELSLLCNAKLLAIYEEKMVEIAVFKQNAEDKEVADFVQMGFLFVVDDFGDNDVIISYFAKRFIRSIFEDDGFDLEYEFHNRFRSVAELLEYGINNYLLSLLERFDSHLAAYVTLHLELLGDAKKSVDNIIKRWDSYGESVERKKYTTLLKCVHEYMKRYEEECVFSETEVLYYVGIEFGIADKIKKYDVAIGDDFYAELVCNNNERWDTYLGDEKALTHYNLIKMMMYKILFCGDHVAKEYIESILEDTYLSDSLSSPVANNMGVKLSVKGVKLK